MTEASIATTTMPLSVASLIPSLSAAGSFGLTTIALTFLAMRSRMSASWPAASTSWWMTVTELTSPDAAAWALAEQIDASRQPLPVPAPFAKPMVYLPPRARRSGPRRSARRTTRLLEQALAMIANAARPNANLARIDPFWVMRSPPS